MARQRDYRAEYARRKARHPGLNARAATGHGKAPARRSPAALFKATSRQAAARKRAREAVSVGREHGWSLSRAAREAHTTADNIRRWVPSAVDDQGHLKRSDTETRLMPIVSAGEVFPQVAVRGSRQAGLVSAHLRAINHYLRTGDEEPLSHLAGVVVNGALADGRRLSFELESDTEVIDALAGAGLLEGLVVGS